MSFTITDFHKNLNSIIEKLKTLVTNSLDGDSSLETTNTIESYLEKAKERLNQSSIKIALIGEFSSGKSSLIAAFTGEDVLIGADVTTTKITEYDWHGLTIVDTPGVQADTSETNHDRVAREATLGADIILFVKTNELFSPRLATHLQYLLDDDKLGLSAKTAIIVNKMDRENNPDEVIRAEVLKALGPYQQVPVYLCSASKYIDAKKVDDKHKSRFIKDSRIPELISSIDLFVENAGKLGQLQTPLQCIEEAISLLQGTLASTEKEKNELELIKRHRKVLQDLERRLLDIKKTWKQQAFLAAMSPANDAVEKVSETTTGDDLQKLFEHGFKQATPEIEQLYDGIYSDLKKAIEDAQNKLEEIGRSSLAHSVEEAARTGVESVDFNDIRPDEGRLGPKMAKTATTPLKEILEAASKDAGGLRDIVYGIGKNFGHNFKPWGAVKAGETLAAWAGRAGKAMPILTVALDFYLQYREEKDKEEKARYLAKMRLALKNTFVNQANAIASTIEDAVTKISGGPVAEELNNLDQQEGRISSGETKREKTLKSLADLRIQCTALRKQIMSRGNSAM